MERERLDRWCEWGIIGLVLGILVYSPLATGAVRPLEMLAVQGMTILALVLWGFRFWLRKNDRILWTPVHWAVLAFVLYAIGRYHYADIEYIARGELLRVILYALLFFLILDNLHRQDSVQWVVFTLLIVGTLISMYAVYQFVTGSDKVWHFVKPVAYKDRGTGTYINPNHLAGFLEMIMPLGLAYVFTGRSKPTLKVFLAYASLAMLVGIGVTVSRGGWVATGASLLVLFAVLLRQRGKWLSALLLAAVVAGACYTFVKVVHQPQRRFSKTVDEGRPNDVRLQLWQSAINMWKDHFWWGVGPAHFDQHYRRYRTEDMQMRPVRVHNDYINTLADWGMAGFILMALVWLAVFWGVIRSWKFVRRTNDIAAKSSNRSAFVLGAAVGLVAILVHSVTDFNMHIPANAIVAVALVALLASHLRFASDRYWINAGWIGRILGTAVCLAGIFYLGKNEISRAQEHTALQRYETLKEDPEQFEQQVAALQAALAAESNNPDTAYELGELHRRMSWAGNPGYEDQAREAMKWFEQARKLNPFDAYNYMRYGMCLDWLKQHEEAGPYFKRALELDPLGYFTIAHAGWHEFQVENYAESKRLFQESLRISSVWLPTYTNQISLSYLKLLDEKLAPKAAPKTD